MYQTAVNSEVGIPFCFRKPNVHRVLKVIIIINYGGTAWILWTDRVQNSGLHFPCFILAIENG